MRRFSRALCLVLLCLSAGAEAQIADLNAAINKAGRERMLSQRMAKAYFQLGQQVDGERSRRVLDQSVAVFDRQLVELKNYAPTPEIKDTYLKLEKAWLAYKDALLGSAPSQQQGRQVLQLSEQVLGLAHQGTVQLEKHAGSTTGHLLNLAGRQRMLSQRMAKFYQAQSWGIGDTSGAAELDKARREFAGSLQELSAAPAMTPAIRDGLELVRQQWFFFDNALNQKGSADRRAQAAVATTSERILEEMETVVNQIEKLGK